MRFLSPAFVMIVAAILCSPPMSQAADSRVLPAGQQPDDVRLGSLKDLDGDFPFHVPATRALWEVRANELQQRVLVATGLWPMPERTALNAVIHGRVQRDGFTVEKVYFESQPGFFVTGMLFRPTTGSGPFPGVLCPHGHGGRLQDLGERGVRAQIESGAERFEASGRFPKLARCAQLARMGCVAFIFDMIGYADNQQLSYELAHRFAKQRQGFDSRDSWGLFGAQAESRLQSVMGIQTWNSIRALDFLCQLPDVDADRIGVTGGSGGGTQTILLCAIDSRPVVAFPQGMVSTSMQGGCTCENCSLLRIGTGNVELAALFAPKPQGMTAANDWTKAMMTKGFPQLQQTYEFFAARGNVACESLVHFPHNYNYVTRSLMYSLFNHHLKLGLDEPIVEQDFELLSPADLTVWDADHPAPAGGDAFERKLLQRMDEKSRLQMAAIQPIDARRLQAFREVVGGAWNTIIHRTRPAHDDIQRTKIDKQQHAGYLYFEDTLSLTAHQEQIPVISFYPVSTKWNGQVVIWLDGNGKAALFDESGTVQNEIRRLLDGGVSVVSADLFLQGEFLSGDQPITQTPVVANPREFAGFTHGYNDSVFVRRVHDVLTLISFVRDDEHAPRAVQLVGVNGAGPIAAAARAVAGEAIDKAAVDTGGFRFSELTSWRDPNFVPGAVKYGDLPALLALSAPHALWIGGEKSKTVPNLTAAAYAATDSSNTVTTAGDRQDTVSAAIDWLLDH